MKKILLGALLCCGSLISNAQQGVTLINNTSCNHVIRLGAGSPYDMLATCFYEVMDFTLPPTGSAGITFPDYTAFASTYAFTRPTGCPPIPEGSGLTLIPGAAPNSGPLAFTWAGALVWEGTVGVPPPSCGVGVNCGGPYFCTPYATQIGTGVCGPNNPLSTPHTFVVAPGSGHLTLTLN